MTTAARKKPKPKPGARPPARKLLAHQFADTAGRVWTLRVTLPAVARVREGTGASLGTALADDLAGLRAILADPVLVCDVCYVLCRDDADALGLTDVEFGEAWTGETLEAAADALTAALANFSPPRVRGPLLTLLTKGQTVREMAGAMAKSAADRIDPAATLQAFATSNSTGGSSPDSAGSTPPPPG